jgi:histidinol dehydrogenase
MTLARLDLRGQRGRLDDVLPRPAVQTLDVRDAVAEILASVRERGDATLVELTERFDGAKPDPLVVSRDALEESLGRIPAPLRDALGVAHRRIVAYHERDVAESGEYESDGIRVTDLVRPVARVGCYAPGGRARYPSTVLMCAVPARVAGVTEVVLCVPPGPEGRVDDVTLAAAAIAGVDELYQVGGSQAIGALAYGTASIAKVDVVVGPGNRYVAEAMRQVSGVVGVPASFAGPSEVVVIAGADTPAELAAVDLAVQAEHGPDGLAWLITWSPEKLDEVDEALGRIVASSARRAELEATLSSGGYACLVEDEAQAMAVANVIAPEHLELMFDDARRLLPMVQAAGAVFLGCWSPASLGDYVAGPNHVLPTNRSARYASALSTRDFRRHIHVVEAAPTAIATVGRQVEELATAEGLGTHAESIRARR